jgi:hypothetical protein
VACVIVLGSAAACRLGQSGLGSSEGPLDAEVEAMAGGDGAAPSPDAADGAAIDGAAPEGTTGADAGPDTGGVDDAGTGSDPGVICGDASCPLGMTCKGCTGGGWTCMGCAGMPAYLIDCDDWADCDAGACCVAMGGGPVTTHCTAGTTCMPDHPLCDPNAVDPCPYGGTCQMIDGMLGGTPYHNCRP